ncbi:MAG TPA: XRE family transcriptional regulator [Acidiferrobacteraceae bacterium]|nr:XRE family transcriptional regulator [Acidiferrobacteraceae bacterium]
MGTIGTRIRKEREQLGFSQSYMGALGGVTGKTQGKYERDERRPDADYLAAVAHVIDIKYVITGESSVTQQSQESIIEAQLKEKSGDENKVDQAISSVVHGMQRAQMYFVPELLSVITREADNIETAKELTADVRAELLVKTYTIIYTMVPNEQSLHEVTQEDVRGVIRLLCRFNHQGKQS